MIADEVAAALAAGGGLTAAELGRQVGAAEEDVRFVLFAGHHRFRCDRAAPPRWWLAASANAPARVVPQATLRTTPSTALGLYRWQIEALETWERQGGQGVVEAVTGTGKTMVGVAAALDELDRRGQVLVLVPTVELQHQWVAGLEPRLSSGGRVGRMGGGATDRLATHDVLVAVVDSARAIDTRPIRQGGLLVADECHRFASAVNRLALDTRFRRRLGLSATYAREDNNLAWLDRYFGGTCYRLGYERAVADGVTARFSVTLVGVVLPPPERACYDELSDRLGRLRARLVSQLDVPAEPFEAFLRGVMSLAESDGVGNGVARAYRQAMLQRRRLLAETRAKDAALALVTPAVRDADRAMVFTQSIAAAERASGILAERGVRVAATHSMVGGQERRDILARFAAGDLDALVAPRVLDEGIDVPAADLAVIVGASRSRRRMIQRMGRVLRRKPDGRAARFAVLFVENTVEDPRLGAHEAFLDEVTGVADRVTCSPAAVAGAQSQALLAALHVVR